MGTTQFPKIPAAPSNPDLSTLAGYVKDMANLFGVLSKELDFLLNGSLDIQNIRAKSITSESIQAGAITTDELAAGAVTADKITVTELSAITADLGHITAGLIEAIEIYGSYIATALAGVYPRIEFSSDNNVLVAEADADNRITVNANFIDSPALEFDSPTAAGTIFAAGVRFVVDATIGDLQLSGPNIRLLFPGSGKFIIDAWSRIYNGTQTLQDALDAKANSFSGVTGTVFVAATSGGATTKAINFVNGIRTT